MREVVKMYIITKITDLMGNNRVDGRYPLRIGRKFAFGLGKPSLFCQMAICYRPRQEDTYQGTLYTSTVGKIEDKGNMMIVTTQNSVYYFQEID